MSHSSDIFCWQNVFHIVINLIISCLHSIKVRSDNTENVLTGVSDLNTRTIMGLYFYIVAVKSKVYRNLSSYTYVCRNL